MRKHLVDLHCSLTVLAADFTFYLTAKLVSVIHIRLNVNALPDILLSRLTIS